MPAYLRDDITIAAYMLPKPTPKKEHLFLRETQYYLYPCKKLRPLHVVALVE
jgi:hypothetical protein